MRREELRHRHAAYFAALASDREPTWWLPADLAPEQPNVRAASDWAFERNATELLLPLGIAIWLFLEPISGYTLMDRALRRVTAASPAITGELTLLVAATSQFALWRGDAERAAALLAQAAAMAETTELDAATSLALCCLSFVVMGLGDIDQAATFAAKSLEGWQRLGKQSWAGESLCLLGHIERKRGHHERCLALFSEALQLLRETGHDLAISSTLVALGSSANDQGDYRRAASLFAESLSTPPTGNDPTTVDNALMSLATLASHHGHAADAARIFGACAALRERHGFDPFPSDAWRVEQEIAPAREQLSEEVFGNAWATGRAQPLEQVIAEAIALARTISGTTASQRFIPGGLTPRELDVLALLVDGRTNQEIADALYITHRTARAHVASILAKLDVPTRAAAASYAIRHDLV